MRQRSNLIVVLGVAVFVIGAAAAWLVLRDGDNSAAAADSVVLYAAKPIPPGVTGESALAEGMVKTRKVNPSSKPTTALSDPSQLAGRTSQVGVPEGQTLMAEQFQVAQTVAGTVNIPPGKEALAVQLANVPGGAGFVGAGDRVDIYGVAKAPGAQPNTSGNGGAVRRIMQNVEVLKVNGTTLVPNQGQPGGPGLVYLLAVNPEQAEHLVFLTSFEQLYFALVPKTSPPTGASPGVDAKGALNPVAG